MYQACSVPACAILLLTLLTAAGTVRAETSGGDIGGNGERYFVLPTEIETDRGAANGDATLLRLMPAYNWKINPDWQIVNLDLVLLADAPGGVPGWPGNPEPIPGDRTTGLSDWIHASFFNQLKEGGLVVGAGFITGFPTATDPALGSGKWTLGPALRAVWRSDTWTIGGFGGQRWSFAGKSNRADISQLMIRATIRRRLPGKWYFVSAPLITANWNAESGNRWLVPLGGGFGRAFRIGRTDWAPSLQFYSNVIRPDGAPDWSVRLSLIAAIPLP